MSVVDRDRPATRYVCPTCDTQGPLLPHEVEPTGPHRAAHQAVWATTIIPTQRAVNELCETIQKVSSSFALACAEVEFIEPRPQPICEGYWLTTPCECDDCDCGPCAAGTTPV